MAVFHGVAIMWRQKRGDILLTGNKKPHTLEEVGVF
jgi:hypothetical protein